MDIVRTFNLNKKYKKTVVLNNVNLTIEKGDIYGLIGKNGAGKTTLMRIICGLSFPDSGSFSLFGQENPADIIKMRSKIGAIIETPSLYGNFSAKMNLKAAAIIKGIGKDSPKIDRMLEFAGLAGTGDKKVKNFSLGMKQRLSIAMALLNDPEFLILDEPVNGLDPIGIFEMREMLKRLNREKGTTILISSHILTELSQLATKFGIIDKGRLLEEITAEKLEQKMSKTLNISFVSKEDTLKALEILKEKFGITQAAAEGDTVVVKEESGIARSAEINMEFAMQKLAIRSLSVDAIDLEQYFLSITKGDAL